MEGAEIQTETVSWKKKRKMEAIDTEAQIDDSLRCSYILPRKKRRCRMLVKKDMKFCGEHLIYEEGNTERIRCPNDGKHTVLVSELEAHLKKCNGRIIEAEYIKPDANSVVAETKFDAKIDRRPTDEEITEVVHKIWKCYEEWAKDQLVVEQRENCLIEAHLKEENGLGPAKRKHLVQISSILGHIESTGVLPNDEFSCMFELGAGKGQLAYWVAKAAPEGNFILMDRSGARNKWDNKATQENPKLKLQRFRCSIEHMDLTKIEILANSTKTLAVCKHFCGSATDAGIRSFLNSGLNFQAALLVPCCHHKSRFAEYGGHELLSKWDMDSEASFSALRYIASFATNGMKETNDEQSNWKSLYPPLELGKRAKAILELGRAEWLKRFGFETKVIEYVPAAVSPENLLILAVKK